MGMPKDEGGVSSSGSGSRGSVVFVVFMLLVMSLPLLCMTFARTDATTENKQLASWPSLVQDGSPNPSFLSQAGDYFSDHFAFKNELVDLDAQVKRAVFGVSATQKVIVGTDGWLYYEGTLDDYQRTNQMSDGAIVNAAHNIALMQEYVEGQGASFAFGIAPDKSSLYPSHMPYYLPAGEGEGNAQRLAAALAEEGVNYVDLFAALSATDQTLYFKTDTHWNSEGASVAASAFLEAVGKTHGSYAAGPTSDTSHVSDLGTMLAPLSATNEAQPSYPAAERYHITNGATSVEDATIQTASDAKGKDGHLLVFRDSFGNALLPFLATEYSSALFTKMVPYDLTQVVASSADDVLVERAERHIDSFATEPPYMPAPTRDDVDFTTDLAGGASLTLSMNGPYLDVKGDATLGPDQGFSRAYVVITSSDGTRRTFEAFRVSAATASVEDTESTSESFLLNSGDSGYDAHIIDSDYQSFGGSFDVQVVVSGTQGSVCVLERDGISISDVD